MAAPIMAEKRTRSQLTLPDYILKVPQRSPLKDARTAMRNNAALAEASMSVMSEADDTDDELLLSPAKNETQMRTSNPKRSASPLLRDDYAPSSGSPSEARELKRVRRDPLPALNLGIEQGAVEVSLVDKLKARGHSRNSSEPNGSTGRRSTRKRAATIKSHLSASPPPSTYSSPGSLGKGRAQSVPLFSSTQEIMRIDFTNPPPSPKRSRSRSPSKDRTPKLHITSGPFSVSQKLGTIMDEHTPVMEIDGEKMSEETIATPLHLETLPPSLPADAQQTNDVAISPPTPVSNQQLAMPEMLCTPTTIPSLDRLIPMSPLTPLPETPFPPRTTSTLADRITSRAGWGMPIVQEDDDLGQTQFMQTQTVIPASTSKSRLPRPSMAPPALSSKPTRVMSTAQPSLSKAGPSDASKRKGVDIAPKLDAFVVLKRAQEKRQAQEKAKPTVKSISRVTKPGPSSIFGARRNEASGFFEKPKASLKSKMRPREKPMSEATPLLVPLPEDEDEEVDNDNGFSINKKIDDLEAVSSSVSPEPLLPVEATRETDVVMVHMEPVVNEDTNLTDGPESLVKNHEDNGVTLEPAASGVEQLLPTETLTSIISREILAPEENGEGKALIPQSNSKSTKAHSSLGKKRLPSSVVPVSRVTRSVSRQKGKEPEPATTSLSGETSLASGLLTPAPAKRTASADLAKPTENVSTQSTAKKPRLLPASPMKLDPPLKSPTKPFDGQTIQYGAGRLSMAKTPSKSKIPVKPHSTPSPTKIARSASLSTSRPSAVGLSRTFSMDTVPTQASGSSLSTLSNALEKLRMPPPSRPNTSMGFNPDSRDDDDIIKPSSQDDGSLGRTSIGLGRRCVTLGASAFQSTSSDCSSKLASGSRGPAQKTPSLFVNSKNKPGQQSGFGLAGRGLLGGGKPIFGFGGGVRRTVSKKTTLPVVMGSPVKGGTTGTNHEDDEELSIVMEPRVGDHDGDISMASSRGILDDSDKGKEKAPATDATKLLSHSLSSLPVPTQISGKGLMGPPATPPTAKRAGQRSISSTYPSASASSDSPPIAGPALGTRASARIAQAAPRLKGKGAADGPISSTSKSSPDVAAEPLNPEVAEALKILKDCKIFVDVKTDGGDEAGSLFVEMLEGLGAKVQTRVGSTCTHIVYKNGLMSTLTRYRLMQDPKPKVVGIGWVVECVEQRKHIDETNFLVDVENTNVAGINRRRRSMLPKMFSTEFPLPPEPDREDGGDGDISMDGSTSSITMDDDLPPLERARRRKSMMTGPRP